MNKNIIVIYVIIGVLALGGIGYAVWNSTKTPVAVVQNPQDTTTPVTPAPVTPVDTTPQAGVPIVQTNANTAPYISTVVVKGVVNPNGALTTYWYEFGLTSALGNQTKGYLAGSGYANIYAPAYIVGLLSNTNYYFRLSAQNSLGTTNGSTYSFKTNTTPLPSGTAPTTSTQSATDITNTTVNLHGKLNPNGDQSTFWFEYGVNANLGTVTAFQSADASKTTSTVSISASNLQPLTKYYFRLNAQNQFGTINGEILNFTTKGPAQGTAPVAVTNSASAINSTSAKLNANINAGGTQTTYWFEYSTNSLPSSLLVKIAPEQTLASGTANVTVSANVNSLMRNTKYYFRVVAKNQYGTVNGSVAAFTTKR